MKKGKVQRNEAIYSLSENSEFQKQLSVSLKIYLFKFNVLWNKFAFYKEQKIFS